MFSFHKPKIYRSNLGCCICKAKSSSSRFTDSKKYENEFERCFRINEKRSGEICNACVLLVKRWKKLSPENRLTKHWHHVVDARAGPGTKLTGNRRLTASASSSSNASAAHSSSSSSSSNNYSSSTSLGASAGAQASSSAAADAAASTLARRAGRDGSPAYARNRQDVLPLTSCQSTNSQTPGGSSSLYSNRRRGSFSKARAIDTNVSTFTFGEPIRRNYMSTAPETYSSLANNSFAKPQSALNSAAFESVIKRFRQRQQQQQLEAQKRLQTRQQRQLRRQHFAQNPAACKQPASEDKETNKTQQQQQHQDGHQSAQRTDQNSADEGNQSNSSQDQLQEDLGPESQQLGRQVPGKRLKRSSESIGSLTIDGLKVSSILDASVWRKEKICCGYIFRGLYNEVAVFPKLLKSCDSRRQQAAREAAEREATKRAQQEVIAETIDSPPPRATKSGSISSCDSNTSGTGSMELAPEELASAAGTEPADIGAAERPALANKRKSNLRGSNKPTSNRLRAPPSAGSSSRANRRAVAAGATSTKDSDAISTSSSSSGQSACKSSADSAGNQLARSPAASSSSESSSRLLLMADEDEGMEVDEDEEELDGGLVLDEEDGDESNTDASSTVESVAELERKKANVVGAMG